MTNEKFIILDTETANTLDDPFVYDVGFAVIDSNGKVYETHSYVVYDIFYGESDLMKESYFADKIPQYNEEIRKGLRAVRRLKTIKFILRDVCAQWNIKAIIAHNARFDYNSLQTTQRYTTSSKYRWFFPYGVEIWDTLKMARNVFGKDEQYKAYCEENNFLTNYGKPQMTAEVLYRYIKGNKDFIESHTGLEDVMIEKEIFVECLKRNSNVERCLW